LLLWGAAQKCARGFSASTCGRKAARPRWARPSNFLSGGTIQLEALLNATPTGNKATKQILIYLDHLARDMMNFGSSQKCVNGTWRTPFGITKICNPKMLWNCHGSVKHAYNDSGDGYAETWDLSFIETAWVTNTNIVVSHKAGGGGSHPPLGPLARGDVVIYYSNEGLMLHSQTCTGNGTETYGANNDVLSYPGSPANQSWKWAVSSAGDWANNMWSPAWPTGSPTNIQPIRIKVYKKP
jgi:hypothetical protein